MAITAASIEANGWVLRLTLAGSVSSAVVGFNNAYTIAGVAPDVPTQWATNFSAYALAPNGAAPALVVSASASGYVQSGGQAVASPGVARSLIGTKVLRKAVDATAAGLRRPKYPDEIDNGDGTITVRIALSQTVYATDTGLSLAALAGWRTGMAAQSISVTNNSTVPAPAPIVRWSDVPFQLKSGTFTLEVTVAAFHPNGLAPAAGGQASPSTDNTTLKTYLGDGAVDLDRLQRRRRGPTPTGPAAPGSRCGSIRSASTRRPRRRSLRACCAATSRSFRGSARARTSDTGDTKSMTSVAASNTPSMTNLATAAVRAPGPSAFRSSSPTTQGARWITPRYIDIDATNGTDDARRASPSGDALPPPPTPARRRSTSRHRARRRSTPPTSRVAAANGQSAITRSARRADVMTVRKANGTTVTGCTGILVGSGAAGINFSGVDDRCATFLIVLTRRLQRHDATRMRPDARRRAPTCFGYDRVHRQPADPGDVACRSRPTGVQRDQLGQRGFVLARQFRATRSRLGPVGDQSQPRC